MIESFTIGGLARAAEVATSTLRYYERIGLLPPAGRTAGNYRYYDQEALERLRFIRAAQANGFTLEDITSLLSLRDGKSSPCQEIQSLIEGRLSEVTKRLNDLRHVQDVLRSSLERCREAAQTGRCEILAGLDAASSLATSPNTHRKNKSNKT